MKLLIDMNLSPEWREVFRQTGWESVHWSQVGAPDAPDAELMKWARVHGHVVFTHDLDFGRTARFNWGGSTERRANAR